MQTHEQALTKEVMPKELEGERPSWRATVEPWWKATQAVLPVFMMTRIIFLLLSYLGGILFFVPNYAAQVVPLRSIVYTWYRWDAIRFATIAAKGYVTTEYAAFFPLYPLLERGVSRVLHLDVLVAGMLISNGAFLAALIVLYRLVEREFDQGVARRSVLYLTIFPTAFFFFAAYNESLFILCMLLCFYMLRQGSWWLAGLFGGLATLTRSMGIFLFVIFLYEFARQMFPLVRQAWREKQRGRLFRQLSPLMASVLIPLGLGIYAYALNKRFGDALAFSHAQVHWRSGPDFPWVALSMALGNLIKSPPLTFLVAHTLIDLCAVGLFLVLLVFCFVGPERFSKSQWSFALFGCIALIYALLFPGGLWPGGLPADPIPSTQRLVLEIFAGFILLARLGRRPWLHQSYLLLALPLLAFFALQFMTGHWTV